METPESAVNAVHPHLPDTSPAFLVGDDAGKSDHRDNTVDKGVRGTEVIRQALTKESSSGNNVISTPETLDDQVTKAAAHRIADEKRPSENSHGGGHARDDRGVRAPVVLEAAAHQAKHDQLSVDLAPRLEARPDAAWR